VFTKLYQKEAVIIRESTKETRELILKSAMDIFLETGYQEASMRKIAARAGITAGAIYKHFSGKEEMFGELFHACGKKLMRITESMIGVDFSALSDAELVQVLYSKISMQTLHLLQDDMQLLHMLLKNDSGTYLAHFRSIYIDRCTAFASNYYEELYRRGITSKKLSEKTIYMLSSSEFSMICEMIADDACQNGITEEMKAAFTEAMTVLLRGLEAELDIQYQTGGDKI
jgi:AcrR family transcriptional regulator